MEWLDSIWAVVGAGIGIFVSVNLLFFKSDDFFGKEFKEDVSLRLLCAEPPDSNSSWPDLFIRLFDRIFKRRQKTNGKQLLEWRLFVSWRTFLLSILASIIAVIIVGSIRLAVDPMLFESIFHEYDSLNILVGMITITFVALFLNVIPDYVSILGTRYLLHWLSGRSSAWRLSGLLALDAAASAIIFLLLGGFILWMALILIGYDNRGSLLGGYLELIANYKTIMWFEKGDTNLFGIFFYSTFFTSVWLWLFGLSHLAITLASRTGPLLRVVRYVLPIDEKPFRSLGIIAGLIAMLGYWGFAAYQWAGTTIA